MVLLLTQDSADMLKAEQLYTQYRYLLYSRAYHILNDKYLSEDAVQQAFLRIMNNLHKIGENNCPQTRRFLIIICENIAKNLYNRRLYLNKSVDGIEETEDETADADNAPEDIVINKETVLLIEKAIQNLPPIYRDVLHLKSVYDCTNQDIGDLLDLPMETVKKRLQRARQKLIRALVKEGLG